MKAAELTNKQKKELRRILIAGILFAVLMIVEHTAGAGHLAAEQKAGISRWVMLALFLIPYAIVGLPVLRTAVLGIGHGQIFDESFLMSLATIGAFAVGENAEAVAVMLFYQVGEFFQSYAVGKSRRSISALMELAPEYANVEDEEGNLEQVDPDEVEQGTRLVILPGEKIPIDGVVEEGESLVSTAAMTGEPVPRSVRPGSEVISGCVNGEGTLRIRTTKLYEDSTVAKVLDLVENAAAKKSRTENFITRFAKYYTPVVVIGALILAVVPPLFLGGWGSWILRACTFLVISCPCALVISVPLSFFGGIGAASKKGILVKGSNYLELLTEAGTVVTDKTGTLTRGVFKVQELRPAEDPCADCDTDNSGSHATEDRAARLLRAAAAAEQLSTHPIALSITEAFEKQYPEQSLPKLVRAENHSGQGLEAYATVAQWKNIRGADAQTDANPEEPDLKKEICILAGNAGLMQAYGVAYTEAEDPAATVVYVAEKEISGEETPSEGKSGDEKYAEVNSDGKPGYEKFAEVKPGEEMSGAGQPEYRYLGALLIADEIKPEAGEAVAAMQQNGIDVVMLTGDRKEAAEAVAGKLGIKQVKAELLPAGKVEAVEQLLTGEKKLLFVGDGINDAPVLARADVGIAMGSLGSDAAIEAADIVIMDDDLRKIPLAVRIAKKTMRIARQNIVFALGVKILILILGALGLANMWAAVFADVGVAVIAILNAMRTLRAAGPERDGL